MPGGGTENATAPLKELARSLLPIFVLNVVMVAYGDSSRGGKVNANGDEFLRHDRVYAWPR
jgi:hypothetical protein